MNPQWHDWNDSGVIRSAPEIVDATLAELRQDPRYPTPTPAQALEWLHRCRPLGVKNFEVATLFSAADVEEATVFLQGLLAGSLHPGELRGLIFTLREGCPWPARLVQEAHRLEISPEFRWLPERPDCPQAELGTCCLLRAEGFAVSLVIPDAHKQDPICLSRWIQAACRNNLELVEITCGEGSPWRSGIQSLLQFVEGLVPASRSKPRLGWSSDHGLGLALAQCLEAWKMGVQRVRTSLYGCGRSGNVPLELLLVNLDLEGAFPGGALVQLSALSKYGEDNFDLEIPHDYPVFGTDAFRTATGVHAAAIVKAQALGRQDLADQVYSSVSASKFGLAQKIEVGPMSGRANVTYWLERNSLRYDRKAADSLLASAKASPQVLTDLELIDLYQTAAATERMLS